MPREKRILIALAMAVIAAIALAQTPPSNDAVWNDFTAWLRNQPPNSKPGDLIRSYRENLVHRGLPEAEARRRMNVQMRFSRAAKASKFSGTRCTPETTPFSCKPQARSS